MDDIRRPNPQRRDFAMRHRPHQPRPSNPDSSPQPPQYQPQPPAPQEPRPLDYEPDVAPAAASETGYEHYSQPVPQPRPQAAAKKRLLPKISLKYAAGGLAAVILIAAGAYILTRPAQKSGFTVAQLSKKSTFGFYYPQPLPNGYVYETKINAFQNGQAYFMLAKGSKHIVFHEQASTGGLDTNGLSATQTVQSSVGKAAIGTQDGQPAAKVLAGSTLISINSTGSVPASDVTQAISHLKTDR